MNLDDVFRQTAQRQPLRPAMLGPGPGDRMSYAELDRAIDAAAVRLHRAGTRPGDCVGLHYPSGADYIVLNYAIWRCGGCVVPIPVELAAGEKLEICRQLALDSVVTATRNASFLGYFSAHHEISRDAMVVPLEPVRQHPPGFAHIHSAFIRFTSGTTGTSKGVVLSHETIHERIEAANEALRIGPEDRITWLLSMSYHFAVSIVSYLSFGAAIVLPANHFASAVLDATFQHRGTLFYASPMHYAWMAQAEEQVELPSVRLAISTTTPLDGRTAERFARRFGRPISQALGIIEVGLPFINVDFAADRSDGVGRVLPAYRLRLEDVGLGPHLKEILLSGKGFLDAYYLPWRTRAEIMPHGWFRTGDVGEMDGDGCLFIRGRTKELIDVLGVKFFPQEVEDVLLSHPQVASASVFAQADPRLGEVPCARVVQRPGTGPLVEQELLDFCRKRLADYKVPQHIEFVQNLGRTASGKVLRRR